MGNNKQTGQFAAPAVPSQSTEGAAEVPVNTGVMDAPKASKTAVKTSKAKAAVSEMIKVRATEKAWYQCKRIVPGTILEVPENKFSEKWMEKI